MRNGEGSDKTNQSLGVGDCSKENVNVFDSFYTHLVLFPSQANGFLEKSDDEPTYASLQVIRSCGQRKRLPGLRLKAGEGTGWFLVSKSLTLPPASPKAGEVYKIKQIPLKFYVLLLLPSICCGLPSGLPGLRLEKQNTVPKHFLSPRIPDHHNPQLAKHKTIQESRRTYIIISSLLVATADQMPLLTRRRFGQ
uniref:SFRICE_027085 n=1 Tax=Spodoptera frugiperda TaxID=7108 RepID=A0A2H1WES8_SPOFR